MCRLIDRIDWSSELPRYKDQVTRGEKESIYAAIKETQTWIKTNPEAEEDEVEEKTKKVESIAGKIKNRIQAKINLQDKVMNIAEVG